MIDWDMGQSAGSLNSGRKTQVLGVSAPPPAPPAVTAGRSGVGLSTPARDQASNFRFAVSAALDGLAVIENDTRRIARALRGSEITAAHRDFEMLVDAIRSLTMLTAELGHAAAAQDDRADEYCASPSVCATLSAIASAVEGLIESHHAGDWRGLAGSMETSLLPALRQWRTIFDAIATGCVA